MSQESGKKKTTEQDDIHPRWKSVRLNGQTDHLGRITTVVILRGRINE